MSTDCVYAKYVYCFRVYVGCRCCCRRWPRIANVLNNRFHLSEQKAHDKVAHGPPIAIVCVRVQV